MKTVAYFAVPIYRCNSAAVTWRLPGLPSDICWCYLHWQTDKIADKLRVNNNQFKGAFTFISSELNWTSDCVQLSSEEW